MVSMVLWELMSKNGKLKRKKIIQVLVKALEPIDYIHAFWEGGAAAFNRVDEWSDIDIYLVVDKNKVEEAFLAVEDALKSLTEIKQKYDIKQTSWPGIFQAFYRLEGTTEYMIIDLAVLTINAPDKLLEPEIHGKAVFYFNKLRKIKPPPVNKKELLRKMRQKLEKIHARYHMFNNFVQKEINRRNHIEAIYLYHRLTLDMLNDILRIKYSPFHYDFKTRYIHYELPPEIIEKLKPLYFIEDENDLQQKYEKANKWIDEVVKEVNQKKQLDSNIRQLMQES